MPAPRRRRGRVIGLTITIIVVVLLAATVWLAFRALTVKTELEAAQRSLASLQSGEDSASQITELARHADVAAAAAGDPVWRVAELVPVVGDNLRAVRVSAESLDVLAGDVGVPVLASFDAPEGTSALAAALPVIADAAPRVVALAEEVEYAHASRFLIGPVRSGIDQVAEVMAAAGPTFEVLPGMLGADGPRNYLLVFQNTAETMPLGGSAAAQTLLGVDSGAVTILNQTGSGDYLNRTPPDVAVDQSAIDLYTDYLVRYTNTTTSRPDFPTAAELLRAFWQRDIAPDQIDGVISIDPRALSRVLVAIGPVEVEGVQITSENAQDLLLSEVYTWADAYTRPEVSDGFFAAATQEVFARVASGQFSPKDMLWAVGESASGGDLMMWSTDAELQTKLAALPLGGVLPTDNATDTVVGVYYRDTSASKIDYYMDSAATVVASCSDGATTFTATGALHLDIDQRAADALPRYVKSFTWGSAKFRTEVFVYGPPGTTVAGVTVNGADARELRTDIVDLGRPVASFEVFLSPGDTADVSAVFQGTGDFGPVEVRTNPMVRTPETSVQDGRCGA